MLSIVYTSNTGYTKQYAEMVAKKLCLPIYTIKQAKKELNCGSDIIYFGWLMANSVKDYNLVRNKFNIKAVCAVGLCETGCLLEEARKVSKIPNEIPLFTLQGGMDREKLKGINKFMINMLIKMLKSNKTPTPEQEAQLKLIIKGGNYVNEKHLTDFLLWYEKSGNI